MMKKYKFWSIYKRTKVVYGEMIEGYWFCIPPSRDFVPTWYPKGALVKHHEEEYLPPPKGYGSLKTGIAY